MEEFQEADVLWPDHRCAGDHGQTQRRESRLPHHVVAVRAPPRQGSSAPVCVPDARSAPTTEQCSWAAGRHYSGDDGEGSASFVAPHEIAARRRCAEVEVERSVCVGRGRTLKGRDLRSVRAAVLRMTGFLET